MNAEKFAAYQKQFEPQKRFAYHKTHTPPCIGMYVELLGRFALLASYMDGAWKKFAQELIIGEVISPNPEGWVEVTLKDVQRIFTEELATLSQIAPPPVNRCPISYAHQPHDYCDGTPSDHRKLSLTLHYATEPSLGKEAGKVECLVCEMDPDFKDVKVEVQFDAHVTFPLNHSHDLGLYYLSGKDILVLAELIKRKL